MRTAPARLNTKASPSVSHNELNDLTHLKGVTLQVCHWSGVFLVLNLTLWQMEFDFPAGNNRINSCVYSATMWRFPSFFHLLLYCYGQQLTPKTKQRRMNLEQKWYLELQYLKPTLITSDPLLRIGCIKYNWLHTVHTCECVPRVCFCYKPGCSCQ